MSKEKAYDTDEDFNDPNKYVNLERLASTTGSFEEYLMMCNLIGVEPGTLRDYNSYKCKGGHVAAHYHPLYSYVDKCLEERTRK